MAGDSAVRHRLSAVLADAGQKRALLPTVFVAVVILAQVIGAIVLNQHMFWGVDAIEYITHRGAIPGDSVSILAPWAGHFQPIPILIMRGLFAVFGFTYYLPTILVSILLHAASSALLYTLLIRVGGSRWAAALTAVLMAVLGAGSEAFLWEGPMPIAICVFLGFLGLWVLVRAEFSTRSLAIVAALLLVGVMSSGAIIGIALFLFLFTALRAGVARALALVAIPALVLGVWLLTLGRDGGRVRLEPWEWTAVPRFVWHGMTFALDQATGITGAGAVLLVALVVGVMTLPEVPEAARHLGLSGLVSAAGTMALSALAGMRLGIGATESSRYAYLVIALSLPAVCACTIGLRHLISPAMVPAAIGVASLMLGAYWVQAIALERQQSEGHGNFSRLYLQWFMGNREALRAGQKILTPQAGGDLNYGVNAARLAYPAMLDALPDRRGTAQERLQAESQFYVGVGESTYHLFTHTDLASVDFQTPVVSRPGCHQYMARSFEPELRVLSLDGVEIGVTSASTQISTAVERHGVSSDFRQWGVRPNVPLHLATTARDAVLVVKFNAGGSYTVCTN